MSTHKTVFSHELRILACANCGAPIDGTIAGGSVSCTFCHTANQLQARDESNDRALATMAPTMSEAQRFERLRAQDGQPLIPPPSVQHLLVNCALPPQNLPAAQAEWQQARVELMHGGAFATAERFYFLTWLIYSVLSKQNQDRQLRAVLETARDHLTELRYRQEIHGMLARNAARLGDTAAADEWLGLCSPYSDDLHADTAFRFSQAYVSTAKQDFQRVVQVLGARIEEIPINDSCDGVCGVLRANAYEKMGQMEMAVSQLAQLMMSKAASPASVDAIIAANPAFGLCPYSAPQAKHQLEYMQANAVRTRGGFNFNALFYPIFIGGFAIPGVIFLAQKYIDDSYMNYVIGGVVVTFMVFISFMLWFTLGKGARLKAQLRESGVLGQAQILATRETGVRVNNQPQLELQLQVAVAGHQPYAAIHREVVSMVHLGRLTPGTSLTVRVHPSDPSLMVIEW